MHAPSDKRMGEIVEDIIKCVECPPEVAPFILRIVSRLIGDLRTLREPFMGNQKDNVKYAEELHYLITKLEQKLKNMPNSVLASFLFGERFWQVWADAQGTPVEINANTRSYIAQERLHQNHFAAILSRLRIQCDEIIKREPGIHGAIKYQQRHAARAGQVILETAATHKLKKLRLTCSETSKFVRIASLFHEAATGEYDANLLVACKALKAELDAKK
jgi:hypothetical protein